MKRKCEICKIERNEKNFYVRVKQNICKDCLKHNINYNDIINFMKFLKKNDLPFINDIYKKQESLGSYMKAISSLPYVNSLNFESGLEYNNKKQEDTTTFLQETVTNLKEEVKLLNINIAKNRNVPGTYKNLINALREVLMLIDRYDFKIMYREYWDVDKNKKQVAIWEQNGEGIVRNHKVWNVEGGNAPNLRANNPEEFGRKMKDIIHKSDISK